VLSPQKPRTDQWIQVNARFRACLIAPKSRLQPRIIVYDQSRRRAIADAPAMSSASANGRDRKNSDTMSPPGDTNSNAKRKSEDGGSAQPRAKRNRYISIAWYATSVSGVSNAMANLTTAMSASGARSSAMARHRASAAAISISNASMRRTAATTSRSQSELCDELHVPRMRLTRRQ
jgi:hypothetical protein